MEYSLPVLKIDTGLMTPTAIKARIAQIDQIIDLHLAAQITGAANSTIVEYELHTGQTKTRVEKTNIKDITDNLTMLQKYRDYLAAKLSPRVIRRVSVNSFKNYC